MKFKPVTYFKTPSYIIESSEYYSPIRWDDWCLRESERMEDAVVVSKHEPKTNRIHLAIFREV